MKSLLYLLYLMTLLWLGMVLFGSSSSLVKGHEGQCAFADRCCVGRDSSCVVNGLQSNGQMVDHPCYCDEGCLETGDCCLDYEQVCNVQLVDCQLSAWSEWSSCDRSCGKGVQSRTRVIVQHPSPGKPPCDALEQKRACMGLRCSLIDRKYKSPIRETAGLLPAKYFKKRYQPEWDVRENLFEHQKKLSQWSTTDIMSTNSIEDGYQADQPYSSGTEGKIQKRHNEPNQYCIVFELARVTKACSFEKDFYQMEKGQQMCALCPADAQRKNLGGRCKGHGVDSRLTKWRSTTKPKCRGKWKRVKELRHCPCHQGPDYVFV